MCWLLSVDLRANPFYLSDDDVNWVIKTKESLTVDEKLEQLFFAIGYFKDEEYLKKEILKRNPGGLMFRGGSSEELRKSYSYLQENSKVPMLFAANLESGGDGLVREGTPFGKQMQVSATGEKKQAYRLAKIACSEASSTGCNYSFAPVCDIDLNYHNPIINVRSYGSDWRTVKEFCLQYLKGAAECNVATAVKHFPGDGVDEVDQHILTSVNSLSAKEWDKTYGKVYKSLIDAGTLTIMAGHIAMPAYQKKLNKKFPNKIVPATLSPELLKGLLREKLGFNGMIITDASIMIGFTCAMDRKIAVPYCIEAGCDMFLFTKDYEEDLEFMKEGYKSGILSPERLDDAVTRILAVKASLGLGKSSNIPDKEKLSVIGCKKHLQWAKECADKSVTLVKDNKEILPISPKKTKRVLLEVLGGFGSEERIKKRFSEKLENEGFNVTVYEDEVINYAETRKFETVNEFREKFDIVIYVGNVETASSRTANRLSWHMPYGLGNNAPWFTEILPTVFVSLQNPYHLLDVPMISTYINAYSNHNDVIDAVIEKLVGKSTFKGKSPIDPFCGKDYLKY